ncbi:N-sulphoglucosamine sulphohydrolase [Euwallacea similis]|uniref:N-sulphoglucosamine sulphohydrolase n=1 Tax=Euwallacea similis TaxID=1736056 RepID=UPI00344E4BCA
MGAYLNKICQTPNLDNLAKNSLIFNKAFTSVSSCSPSRSAILTGMPSHENGMYGLHQGVHHFDSLEVDSLPKILRRHSIRTGIIGKKHVGPGDVYPFDYAQTEENNSILQVGRNITYIKLLTREFLNSTEDKPFFLYIAFHDPHRCGHTNPQYGEFCERFGNGEEGMGLIPDWTPIYYQWDEIVPPYYIPDTEAARKDIDAQYITMSRLDQGVGLVLKELQDAGHLDDTLVIFSSDNGVPFPNGRTNFYDSGIAEPMFISSPIHRERRNQITNSLTSLLDIVPTLLDWYGISENVTQNWATNNIEEKRNLTGKSLLPLLIKEPDDKSNEAIFASHNLHEVTMYYPMRMIRTQRYKLIHNLNYASPFPIDQDFYLSPTFQDLLNRTKSHEPTNWFKTLKSYYNRPEWELYDLKVDPAEINNLALKPSMKEVFNQLKKRLFEWQKDTQDPWICAPHAVLENQGSYKNNPSCLDLDNIW